VFINVPSEESLTESSLKLYFTAWTSLLEIMFDFLTCYEIELYSTKNQRDGDFDYSEEEKDYLERCNYELQLISNWIQQSNELALKAKISKISPYLLLSKYEKELKSNTCNDFSDFRTIAAEDLPKTVNAVTDKKLNESFIKRYDKLRKERNKIIHLGHSQVINAKDLIEDVIDNYIELWPERFWLQDRLTFLSKTRTSHFQEHTSPEGNIFDGIEEEMKLFSPEKFKEVFKIKPDKVVSLCPNCFNAARTDANNPKAEICKTAFKKDKNKVHCLMCQDDYILEAETCKKANCKGSMIIYQPDYYEPFCSLCGPQYD
jgi:hypothetical protein